MMPMFVAKTKYLLAPFLFVLCVPLISTAQDRESLREDGSAKNSQDIRTEQSEESDASTHARSLQMDAKEARREYHRALREHMRQFPDMTPGEDRAEMARFLRDNFEWRVEVLQKVEASRRVQREDTPRDDVQDSPALVELMDHVNELRRTSSGGTSEEFISAYERAARELIEIEETQLK